LRKAANGCQSCEACESCQEKEKDKEQDNEKDKDRKINPSMKMNLQSQIDFDDVVLNPIPLTNQVTCFLLFRHKNPLEEWKAFSLDILSAPIWIC